jgi:hypothetical protein
MLFFSMLFFSMLFSLIDGRSLVSWLSPTWPAAPT